MKKNILILTNIIIVGIVISLYGCKKKDTNLPTSNFTWNKLGLNGLKVHELVLHGDSLYAATNDGLYAKNINTKGDFISLGLKDKNVIDLLVISNKQILVSIGSRFNITQSPDLFQTTNGGNSWEVLLNNFGGPGNKEQVYSLSQHPSMPAIIYGTGGYVLAKSADYGITWQPIWGFWDGAASGTVVAEVNPKIQSEIWFGGQGAIENGYLGRLRNEVPVNDWTNLVPNPTVAVELAFDSKINQNIYAGFEGALMQTSDNGSTWKKLIDGHSSKVKFFFGIAIGKSNPDLVFSGGWLKTGDPQPMTIYYSTDAGNNWKNETNVNEQWGGILDMKIKEESGRTRLFAGLDKGGVYELEFKIK